MALRPPIVLVNGQLQQLQAGDTLNAPQAGGNVVVLTNDEAGAVVIGSPVYVDANDGFKKAQANGSTTKDVVGLVAVSPSIANGVAGSVQTDGVMSATTGQWDAAFGTTGGLTKGVKYWLSPTTAGLGTVTPPTTVGQYVVLLGMAISATELLILITPGKDVLL